MTRDAVLAEALDALDVPEHADGFLDALELRLAADRGRDHAPPRRRWRPWRAWAPVLAAAAILAAVVVVAGRPPREAATDAVPERAADPARAAMLPQGLGAPPARGPGRAAPQAGAAPSPAIAQRIAQTAVLTVRVPTGELDAAVDKATAAAEAVGGYVVSTRSVGDGAGRRPESATVKLRVPQRRFAATLATLAGLGQVLDRQVTSQDLTQSYVDTRSRLRSARRVEDRLLTLLGRAGSVSEVLAVQDRLEDVQREIEIAKGRLQYLSRITTFATVTVALRTPAAATAGPAGRSWGLRDGLADAAHNAANTTADALRAAGAALPIALLAAAAGAVLLVRRRRRRTA